MINIVKPCRTLSSGTHHPRSRSARPGGTGPWTPDPHNPLHPRSSRNSFVPAIKDSGGQNPEARFQHPEALLDERAGPHYPKSPVAISAERVVPVTGAAAQIFYPPI